MKKILVFAITFVFAAALGVAYAGEAGNGITIFNGKSIDTLADLYPAGSDPAPAAVESANAGGLRSVDLGFNAEDNGITNFSGSSTDTLSDLGPAAIAGVKSHALVKSAPRSMDVYLRGSGMPLTN